MLPLCMLNRSRAVRFVSRRLPILRSAFVAPFFVLAPFFIRTIDRPMGREFALSLWHRLPRLVFRRTAGRNEPFPLIGRCCSERPEAVKGAPLLGTVKGW